MAVIINDVNGAASVPRTFFSWRSIFAGLFITLLSFLVFTSLGLGLGGLALSDLEGLQTLGWSAAAWIIITMMISLFLGSYLATRVFNIISNKTGVAQGLTIAAVFFLLSAWTGGVVTGMMGRTIGGMAGAAAGGAKGAGGVASNVLQNPEVKGYLDQQMREFGVRPERADQVAVGVAQRLISQGPEAAKSYIASETTLSEPQIDQRLSEMRSELMGTAGTVAETSGKAISAAGWYLFFMLVLGSGAAIFGGITGVRERREV